MVDPLPYTLLVGEYRRSRNVDNYIEGIKNLVEVEICKQVKIEVI